MAQSADCNGPLRNINAAYITKLREAFLGKMFNFSGGMITVDVAHELQLEVNFCCDRVVQSDGVLTLLRNLHVQVVDSQLCYQVLRNVPALPLRNDLLTAVDA